MASNKNKNYFTTEWAPSLGHNMCLCIKNISIEFE